MQTYVRIQDGVVAELLATDADPAELFHASLQWCEVTSPDVAVGWLATPAGLAPPSPPSAPPAPPSLGELHARIAALAAEVAALVA